MASYKLNIATIRGCPPATELARLLTAAGPCPGDDLGVRNVLPGDRCVRAALLVRTATTADVEDAASGEITQAVIDTVKEIPLAIWCDDERLELYAGGASTFDCVAAFLVGACGLAVVVDTLELDLLAAVEHLVKTANRLQIRSARVSDYAANSYMIGPYGPKFMSCEHALEFLSQHAEALLAVSVRLAGPAGRVGLTLSPRACFGYSADEDDAEFARQTLRHLAGFRGKAGLSGVASAKPGLSAVALAKAEATAQDGPRPSRQMMTAVRDMIPDEGSVTVSVTHADGTSEKPVTLDSKARTRIDRQLRQQ